MKRCFWVNDNPLYISYHDQEWGVPSYDDSYLFEMLLLESFQAGLSWECILNKREAFRKSFDQFDYDKIKDYDSNKIEELMNNKEIVRNRRKILANIKNAKVFLQIKEEWGSFSNYIWHFTNNSQVINNSNKIPCSSSLSDEISCDLKKRNMKFVGTTIIYSYLQAIGVINDHEVCCDFRKIK